jgi:hypothetical protein
MRKTVVVQETVKENVAGVPTADAKKVVVDKLRKVINVHRKDVENSLIATGSPKAVRGLGYKEFNAAVMNRLAEPGKNGDEFRDDITKLIVVYHGNELTADGFFHTSTVGSNFGFTEEQIQALNDMAAAQEQGGAVTGKQETSSGDVTTQPKQDVGQILTGSAAVLDSVGGIIGLFTGTQPQTPQNNTLNTGMFPPPPPPQKRFPWTAVIIGLYIKSVFTSILLI